jgi:hypothetical protein
MFRACLLVVIASFSDLMSAKAAQPTGYYCMTGLHSANVKDQILDSPTLAGFHVRDTWSYVEPTSSTEDWRYLDGQIARAKRLGKQVTLGIYCGVNSPDWIKTSLGQPPVQYIGGAPVPWDTRVIAAHQMMVYALGQHYSGERTIAAVHLTSPATNQSLEMYYPNGLTSSKDYSDARVITVWRDAIDDYDRAFPATALVLDVAMVPDSGGTVTNAVIDYARQTLGNRINFIHCSLHASTPSAAPVQQTIVALGRQGERIGFEMLCPSSDRQRFGGPFSKAVAIGDAAGAQWYQIYQSDVQYVQ